METKSFELEVQEFKDQRLKSLSNKAISNKYTRRLI